MDYFGAQDAARRKTWLLATLFALAVISLVLLTNLLIAAVQGLTSDPSAAVALDPTEYIRRRPWHYWLTISIAVIAVVALASTFKFLQVRGGGRAVAESLGGRLLQPSSDVLEERRLLNVVEEMAIAAGTPVPPVYLIEEPSINAFAAGFSTEDAVIGINRGTLDHLSRDELQGVVGHEFSHILNGDSRINLNLVALLFGILFIGLVGRTLLYGFGRGRSRSREGNGAPVVVLALGLLVIGYAGTFFGNLIKAAVSRQREYLADAAAVQFTRNPRGIAGALKKIGGLADGSRMPSAAASEMSHMFFGAAFRPFLAGIMATHPPLDRRIRALDPRWDGAFPDTAVIHPGGAGLDPSVSGFAAHALEVDANPDAVANRVGTLDDRGLQQAAGLLATLPAGLRDAARDPLSSQALMYALVVDREPAARGRQVQHLAEHAQRGIATETARLAAGIESLDEQHRLTLVELAVPALKTLSTRQYQEFIGHLIVLIKADARIDLLEWVLHRLLVRELKPHFEGVSQPRLRYDDLGSVTGPAGELLSALARQSGRTAQSCQDAFAAGLQALGLDVHFNGDDDPGFKRLNSALAELQKLRALRKPRLIKACAAVVLADQRVSAREGALLQGIAAALDCPLPPSIYASASGKDRVH